MNVLNADVGSSMTTWNFESMDCVEVRHMTGLRREGVLVNERAICLGVGGMIT